jgi:hypothetical protein
VLWVVQVRRRKRRFLLRPTPRELPRESRMAPRLRTSSPGGG